MTLTQQFFDTISDPTIAYLLITVGMFGLFFEFANPGTFGPGIAGGISLLLGLSSLGNLENNWVGILLMAFAFVLFLIDLYASSHGVLTIGGIASFAFGSFVLADSSESPASHISKIAVVAVTVVLAGFFLFAVGAVVRTRLKRTLTGEEGMRGAIGVARQALDPDGYVYVLGELWLARSTTGPIAEGDVVRVVDVEGLTVFVEPETTSPLEIGDESEPPAGRSAQADSIPT